MIAFEDALEAMAELGAAVPGIFPELASGRTWAEAVAQRTDLELGDVCQAVLELRERPRDPRARLLLHDLFGAAGRARDRRLAETARAAETKALPALTDAPERRAAFARLIHDIGAGKVRGRAIQEAAQAIARLTPEADPWLRPEPEAPELAELEPAPAPPSGPRPTIKRATATLVAARPSIPPALRRGEPTRVGDLLRAAGTR